MLMPSDYIDQQHDRIACHQRAWMKEMQARMPKTGTVTTHIKPVLKIAFLMILALCHNSAVARDCFRIAQENGWQIEEDNSWREGENNLKYFISWNGSEFSSCERYTQGSNESPVMVLVCGGRKYVGNSIKAISDTNGREWLINNEQTSSEQRCDEISPNVYWSIHEDISTGRVEGTDIFVKQKSQILRKVSFVKPDF